MKQQRRKWIIYTAVSLCIFVVAAIVITYPLIFHLGSLSTGYGDELVIAWIQNWVIHSLITDPTSLFNANLYYPFSNSLAYSETFITSSILAIPIKQFIGEPISTVNFTLITALAFLGFSVSILCYYLTKDYLVSVFVGLMLIFSPAVLDKKVHLQILDIAGVPFAILFFLIFLNTKKSKYLVLTLVFFLIQIYNSFLPGYFILFSLSIILIYKLIQNKKKSLEVFGKKNILLIFCTFLLILPVVIPYYQVSKEFNYQRDIRDAVHLAFQPEDFLYPSEHTRLQHYLLTIPSNKSSQNNEFQPGYLGFIFTMLTLFCVTYFIKKRNKKMIEHKSFLSIAILGFVLSLGPLLHLDRHTVHYPFPIPLPYALFYYVMPGFQGFRNAARWDILFILAISVFIALMLHEFLKDYSFKKKSIVIGILLVGCLAEINFPMRFFPIPQKKEFPKVYSWLAQQTPQNSSIIEMPIFNWGSRYTQQELWREYYGTENFRKTVNGYTGFSPPPWQNLIAILSKDFPNQESINLIKHLGVNYIIVHTDEYDELNKADFLGSHIIGSGTKIISEMQQNKSLKLVRVFNNTYIYRFVEN